MANITVSSDIDAFLRSADNAAALDSIGANSLASPHANLTIQTSSTDQTFASLIEGEFTGSDPISFPTGTPNHVSFGNSVTTIGVFAYYGSSITSITIPNSVTSIGSYAFYTCSLTSATIPNSVTSIGSYTFYSNYLTEVTIGNSVTTIGNGAFKSNSLTSVTIPNSVTSIGSYAFYENSLTSVTIGNSVTTIGAYPFSGNYDLATVNANITKTIFDTSSGILLDTTVPVTLNVRIGDTTWNALIAASPTSYQGSPSVTVVATL